MSGKVRETLNRLISGERSKYLQENIITQRNGRFVVPVKVEHRGDVPGLVHDTSSTGATVFVEPQQVVEINNQIKVLEAERKTRSNASSRSCRRACPCTRAPSSRTTMR